MLFRSKFLVATLMIPTICLSSDAKSYEKFFYIINGYVPKIQTLAKHVVMVRRGRGSKINQQHCSGTIVTDRVVVSAAHCFYDKKKRRRKWNFDVIAGQTKVFSKRPTNKAHSIVKIVTHPKFTSEPRVRDLALLFLKEPLKEDGVTIERLRWGENPPSGGDICITLGWGRKSWDGPQSNKLKYAKVRMWDQKICQLHTSRRVEHRFVCSGPDKTMNGSGRPCVGDSGGPLVCNGELSGIISFAQDFCLPPIFYTDVSQYLNWSRAHLQDSNHKPSAGAWTFPAKDILILVISISIFLSLSGLVFVLSQFGAN